MSKFTVQGKCTDKHTTKMCVTESIREFCLGDVQVTPGAQYFLSKNRLSMWDLLRRYVLCDWGDLDKSAWYKADEAVRNVERIHAEYQLADGERILIVTNPADKSSERGNTILLLQKDYWMLDCPTTAN